MYQAGVHYVASITHTHVTGWWDQLAVGDSTKPTRLAQLRSFLNYCRLRDWCTHDPSALLRAPRPAPVPRERLDPTELLTLLDVVSDPSHRVLLALAVNLGLRGGEIQQIRLRDVDLDASEIKVNVEKTHGEIDPMPISSDLYGELWRWLTLYTEACADDGLGRDSYLVPSRYVQPSTRRVFYRHHKPIGQPYDVVQEALRRIGWDDVVGEGVHTVRRSVARIYFDMIEAEETFDSAMLATMTLLHHHKPETTLKYIGRDRLTLARDRMLKGKPFLSRLTGDVVPLRAVQ
jgi:integrase